jgi:hypothetical protein
MKAKDVVGRRVVKVHQQRVWDKNFGAHRWSVDGLEMDNGAFLLLQPRATDSDLYVCGVVVVRKEGARRPPPKCPHCDGGFVPKTADPMASRYCCRVCEGTGRLEGGS